MRKTLALATGLALFGLAVPGVHAATDNGSEMYTVATGGRADDVFLGVSWCITKIIPENGGPDVGCLGGGDIYTSEALAKGCGQDAGSCDATKYLVMTMTMTDSATGPNVYASVCNFNPEGGNVCPGDAVDGFLDAGARGCGVALIADSTGIHTGHHRAVGFAFTLGVDSTTTVVCVGTSGVMNVVFS